MIDGGRGLREAYQDLCNSFISDEGISQNTLEYVLDKLGFSPITIDRVKSSKKKEKSCKA